MHSGCRSRAFSPLLSELKLFAGLVNSLSDNNLRTTRKTLRRISADGSGSILPRSLMAMCVAQGATEVVMRRRRVAPGVTEQTQRDRSLYGGRGT